MDIYAEVTDRIIAESESGIIPWQKPWNLPGDKRALCRGNMCPSRELCVECKEKWLESEVDQ